MADHPGAAVAMAVARMTVPGMAMTAMTMRLTSAFVLTLRDPGHQFRLIGALFVARIGNPVVIRHQGQRGRAHKTAREFMAIGAGDIGTAFAHGLPASKAAAVLAMIVVERHGLDLPVVRSIRKISSGIIKTWPHTADLAESGGNQIDVVIPLAEAEQRHAGVQLREIEKRLQQKMATLGRGVGRRSCWAHIAV